MEVLNMDNDSQTINVLVEPVFNNKKILREFYDISNELADISDNSIMSAQSKNRKTADNLITSSTITSEFYLRVEIKNGEWIDELKLSEVQIRSHDRRYFETFPVTCEYEKEEKNYKLKQRFSTVFPTPGLYWLELKITSKNNCDEIKGKKIETKQRMLNGNKGSGWSDEKVKNFLIQPILVLDSATIYQNKVSKQLLRLTCLTALIAILNLLAFFCK